MRTNQVPHSRRIWATGIAMVGLSLAGIGCGGSGSGTSQVPAPVDGPGQTFTLPTGRAVLSVKWPEPSRLVPLAANAVTVTVSLGNRTLGSKIVTRPSGGGTVTAIFDPLPVADVTVTATAFPNPDGTGTAQATAKTVVTVIANQITPVSLTMASTIDHIELSSADTTLFVGRVGVVTGVVKDVSGAIVVTNPATIQWTSTDPSVATVDSLGNLRALAPGTTQISMTETESGKSASVPVTVTAEPQPISWWKGENNAADAVGGNNGTEYNGVVYTPGIQGTAFSFNGASAAVNLGDPENLKITASLTLDAWVYPTAFPSGGRGAGMILFRGDARDGLDPYYLCLLPNGHVVFALYGADNSSIGVESPISLNRWTHVTGTLDDASGRLSIYLDGKLASQTITAIRPLKDLDPTKSPGIGIGNHSGFPTPRVNYAFQGAIDELKVYNQVVPPVLP